MKALILVVGASGTGKDSLMKEARTHLKDYPKIHFIRRYITRKPGESEENFYVDDEAFEILKDHQFFFSYWYEHHLKYGIPKICIDSLKDDERGILSISRSKIKDFEDKFSGRVITFNITADQSTIKERLKKRNRETLLQIDTRLERIAVPVIAKNLIQFDNNQALEITSPLFISLLKKIVELP